MDVWRIRSIPKAKRHSHTHKQNSTLSVSGTPISRAGTTYMNVIVSAIAVATARTAWCNTAGKSASRYSRRVIGAGVRLTKTICNTKPLSLN